MHGSLIMIRLRQTARRGPAFGLTVALAFGRAALLLRAESVAPTVTASFSEIQTISPDEPIDLSLDRPLAPAEGRLAVFIGSMDATILFTSRPDGLRTAARSLPLPAGVHPLILYLVSPDEEWKPVARFILRVSNDRPAAGGTQDGLEQRAPRYPLQGASGSGDGHSPVLAVVPSLALSLQSQRLESRYPASTGEDHASFTASALQASIRTEAASGPFASSARFDVVGASPQQQALRYGELRERAPQLDLSSYLMQFQFGKAKLSLGQTSFGANRFLIDRFSSRGLSLALPIGPRLDVSLTALNGTNIVGWNNFTGLSQRDHRVFSGMVGFEVLPERPGGLRFEATFLRGSLQPLPNINQGNIADAEHSTGFGFHLTASDNSLRFRAGAGFARSRYTNPTDPTLEHGFVLEPVHVGTRDARYLEASYDILKDLPLTTNTQITLTSTFRHERVDPQFRSVAAYVPSNRVQNQYELLASVGDLSVGISHTRANDNLDNIPSILKSFTRRTSSSVIAPLDSLLGDPSSPSPWLPRLCFSFDRIRQFADSVPSNADFTSSQIPDQTSTNRVFTADWHGRAWRFGYRYNDSLQDNRARATGAPLSSLLNVIHAVTFGLTLGQTLDLNLDLSRENFDGSESRADAFSHHADAAYRSGINVNWRANDAMSLSAGLFDTLTHSSAELSRTRKGRNTGVDLQWSYRLAWEKNRFGNVHGQIFTRYSSQQARVVEYLSGGNSSNKTQTLTAGLTFTFF